MPLPDRDATLATLRAIAQPTIPYHEHRVLRAIRAQLEGLGLRAETDRWGQVSTRLRNAEAKHALVLVAHTDHPGFVLYETRGSEGRARVSGGFLPRCFTRPAAVVLHGDDGRAPVRAIVDDFQVDLDADNNSPGHVRVRANEPLEPGTWAVLDLPDLETEGDELRMAAADDLAGCAMAIGALAVLAAETAAFDVRAVFTRAEETGLFGARLLVEEQSIRRDACVVSIEASNAVYAPPGGGIVVRVGDLYNTFSNDAERYLRVAQEDLAAEGILTQRLLLPGGTCEASTFVRHGWATTAIAVPNAGYHNDAGDAFGPEAVRLSDVRGGIALLAAAAIAAGADASESWWPSIGPVPQAVRRLLAPTKDST